MSKHVVIALFVGALVACGGGSDGMQQETPDAGPELLPGFTPPTPGPNQILLVGPPVRGIQPGQDVTYCSYLDYHFAQQLDINDYQGFQFGGGAHHAILHSVTTNQPAGTHECTDDDMLTARYLAGGGADTPKADLPDGVVIRIPAGTQMMIETHWINAGDVVTDGQAAFMLDVQPPSDQVQTASLFTAAGTLFTLPTGTASTSTECTVQQDMHFFSLGGHEHEWGTHVRISVTPAGGAAQTIYDTPWEPSYQFNPPQNHYTTASPFDMHPGDTIRIDCDYNNDTGAPLPFPTEMCVAWGYFYPTDKQIDCTDGNWPN
jgi:hypothetical protein